MPNHVKNIINFSDCPYERIMQILDDIKYEYTENREEYGVGTFDFNKIIPRPKPLDIESGNMTTLGIELYLLALNPYAESIGLKKLPANVFHELYDLVLSSTYWDIKLLNSKNELLKQPCVGKNDDINKIIERGRKAIYNIQNYGAETWYEWDIKNWGTKWNSYNSYPTGEYDSTISFQTAWDPPHPIVSALAKRYNDVTITHSWADEDIGSNCGKNVYVHGIIESRYDPGAEHPEEAISFAEDVWGFGD